MCIYLFRECGRMVGMFPDLEGEVVWRVEHVMSKWDMLTNLRGNINKRNRGGWTPLMYAILADYPDCVRVLLKYGSDPLAGAISITLCYSKPFPPSLNALN